MPHLMNKSHDTPNKTPVTKRISPISKTSKTSSPKASRLTVSPAQKLSVVPQAVHSRRLSTAPQPSQQPCKLSTTPPEINQTRNLSATPQRSLSRKVSATAKLASPPKPEWIAPPGKYCSASPSPTQIPLPTFVSSARKECSPLLGRRKSAVNISSPLAYQISLEESIATVSTDGLRSGGVRLSIKGECREKTVVKGLGLSFKDPFSSSLKSGFDLIVSDSFTTNSAIPRLASVDAATSPASPASPSLRKYTPTSTNAKDKEHQAAHMGVGTPKRDSLSPTPIPIFSRTVLSRIPHHFKPCHTTPTLTPSPKQTHPYTSNTHITPSCTYGSLTHRLGCGHLVLTFGVEVCGRNCVAHTREWKVAVVEMGGRGREEQGFVANLRDLDAVWLCPCCGVEEEKGVKKVGAKGRRCVSVLDMGCGLGNNR